MHARTVIFPEPRQVELTEDDISGPAENEILIQGATSLISTGTELTAYSGDFPPNSAWSRYVRYPFHPGYSHVGRVTAAGMGVHDLGVGTRVTTWSPHTTLTRAAANGAIPIPDGVADEEAAFTSLGAIVLNGIRLAAIGLGDSVAIVGAGLLGQLAASLAALSGARPVLVVDPAQRRLALAERRGATTVIPLPVADAGEAVREATGGRGADIVLEITGNPAVMPDAVRLARRNGKVIVLGSPRGPSLIDLHDEVHTLGVQIIGAHISTTPEAETPHTPWTRRRNSLLFLDLIAEGKLSVADLITHRYRLADAGDAYASLYADRSQAMGVVLGLEQAAP
ncbi:MAG TPA: zinc-binding dehydrogenase [Chloroflexota bacterium]|nr:zinc-binding dehydrogenase [Chloroflexota bacterium]